MATQQHVIALKASDPLPAVAGLPEGYAVIKDGKTWVVRSGVWRRGAGEPSPGNPIPPVDPADPTPPPPTSGPPSEDELSLYQEPVELSFTRAADYAAKGFARSEFWGMRASGGPAEGVWTDGDDFLHVSRPGFYQVNLQITQGALPTDVRGHVLAYGANGYASARQEPGNGRAYGGGIVYCPDPDPDMNNDGGFWITSMFELPSGVSAPASYKAEMTLTPILFTGPDHPIDDLPKFTQLTADSSGGGIAGCFDIRVRATGVGSIEFAGGLSYVSYAEPIGGNKVRVRLDRVESASGDVPGISTAWHYPRYEGGNTNDALGQWEFPNVPIPAGTNPGTHRYHFTAQAFHNGHGKLAHWTYGNIIM